VAGFNKPLEVPAQSAAPIQAEGKKQSAPGPVAKHAKGQLVDPKDYAFVR